MSKSFTPLQEVVVVATDSVYVGEVFQFIRKRPHGYSGRALIEVMNESKGTQLFHSWELESR